MITMSKSSRDIPIYVLDSSDENDEIEEAVIFLGEVASLSHFSTTPGMSGTASRKPGQQEGPPSNTGRSLRPRSVPEASTTEQGSAKGKKGPRVRPASIPEYAPGRSNNEQCEVSVVAVKSSRRPDLVQPTASGNQLPEPMQGQCAVQATAGKKCRSKKKHINTEESRRSLERLDLGGVSREVDEVQVILPQTSAGKAHPKPKRGNINGTTADEDPPGLKCPFFGCSYKARAAANTRTVMKMHVENADHSMLAKDFLSSVANKGENTESGRDVSYMCSDCSDTFNATVEITEHLFCSDHASAMVLRLVCFGCPTCFLLYPTFTQCLQHMMQHNHNRHACPLKGDNESTVLPLPLARECFNKVMWVIRSSEGFGRCVCLTCCATFPMAERKAPADHLDGCQASFVYVPHHGMVKILEALVIQPWMCDMCGCMLSKRKMSSHVEVCPRNNPQVPLRQRFNTIKELLLYHAKSPVSTWSGSPTRQHQATKRKLEPENLPTGSGAQATASKQSRVEKARQAAANLQTQAGTSTFSDRVIATYKFQPEGRGPRIDFTKQKDRVFQFQGASTSQYRPNYAPNSQYHHHKYSSSSQYHHKYNTRSSDRNNNYQRWVHPAQNSRSRYARPSNRVLQSNPTPEPTQDFLETMAQIILVDLDNWPGFFVKLPASLPDKTFVWGFHAEKTHWYTPSYSCVPYKEIVMKGCFRLHPESGNTKDAADFALCMQAGRLDEKLPMHIPFTVLSGDKAFYELQRQLANGQRVCHILNPHSRNTSYAELYALIASITVH